jgi:hypothetical protein
MGNNPVKFVDLNGKNIDDITVNEAGNVTEIIKNDQPHRLFVEKDGKKTEVKLNDPTNTSEISVNDGTENGEQTILGKAEIGKQLVSFEDKKSVGDRLKARGGGEFKGFWEGIKAIVEGSSADQNIIAQMFGWSCNGEFDFYNQSSSGVGLSDERIYVVASNGGYDGYNPKDFGNFLWGANGGALGFEGVTLSLGAHINNFFSGSLQNYNKDVGWLDSATDQRAISNGKNFFAPANYTSESSKSTLNNAINGYRSSFNSRIRSK